MTSLQAWQREVAAQVAAANRFIVVAVRGMCMGAGAFVVRDMQDGDDTLPFTWRDDAERLARQLNAQHAIDQEPASDADLIERNFARAVQIEGKCPAVSDEIKRGGA